MNLLIVVKENTNNLISLKITTLPSGIKNGDTYDAFIGSNQRKPFPNVMIFDTKELSYHQQETILNDSFK